MQESAKVECGTVFCYFDAESVVKASPGLFPQPFLMTSTMELKNLVTIVNVRFQRQ